MAVRKTSGSTTDNAELICKILNEGSSRVVLFATASKMEGNAEQDGGVYADTNLPLMAALVEVEVPHFGKQYIVLDGLFLTARRYPRYLEVEAVLNAAEVSGNCFFAKTAAPFTARLSPTDAAERLLKITDLFRLDKSSRHEYFSLLSPTMTEKQHKAIY